MADVRLYHPELEVEITVPEESAWVRLENGWEYAAEVKEPETPEPHWGAEFASPVEKDYEEEES